MSVLSSLRRHFDPGSYERGERYQREGRVRTLHAHQGPGGGVRLAATVRGSQRMPYAQVILLRQRGDAVTAIEGECDCPVGFNCKHVAAAVIDWALRESRPAEAPRPPPPSGPQPSAALTSLLSRLDEAAAADAGDSYPDTVRKRLVYALRLDDGPNGAEVVLRILSVSLRKDGGYGADDRPYRHEPGRNAAPGKFVTPSDRAILSMMAQSRLAGARQGDGWALRGDWSAGLVERMLKTGRLHWDDFRANPPLRPGPARAGRGVWRADALGRQRFALALDTPAALALPTAPPLYIDRERWECGTVEADVPPNIAAALLGAPPLPPADVAAFRREAGRFAHLLPALPEPPARTETRRVVPRPVLRLQLAATPYGAHRFIGHGFESAMAPAVPAASLAFDYAGRRVAHNAAPAPLQWMEDGALITAERLRPEEERVAARLDAAGLILNETPLAVGRGQPVRQELFIFPGSADGFDESLDWLHFCHGELPALRAEGWAVEVDPDFPFQLLDTPRGWAFEIGDGSGLDWFGLSLGIEVGGERIDLLPVLRSVIAVLDSVEPADLMTDEEVLDAHDAPEGDGEGATPPRGGVIDRALDALAPEGVLFVPVGEGRFLPLDVERLRPIVGVLMELFGLQPDGAGEGELRIGRAHLGDLAALEAAAEAAGIPLLGADAVRRMARTLREAGGVPAVPAPAGLGATLRPYQQAGLDWLQFLAAHGFGGILADDMGLGKTVQALAHLLAEKEAGRLDRPCLLVAPTSVLGNWRREAERFAPGLRTLVLHGPQRKAAHGALGDFDLVVTSYALLPRDRAVLEAQPWHLVLFDEAQYLKNPTSQATKAAVALEARQRLCLTGTPVENSLDELWSLFSVAVPSLFGDRTGFRRQFRTPIEKHADADRQRVLARRVRPFLLRRTKDEVAGELPAKTEIQETVDPQPGQRDLYETIRLAMDARVREEIARKGLARSRITILDALLKLRQVCCDPRLVKLESARKRVAKGAASAKLELLPELLADGRRILLFSQFTSMLDLIEPELDRLGIPFVRLSGDTRDRETPVGRFQSGLVPLFLISLKAGGTGLNLTAADTVIHYDPWWNPAVEDQATDRAHRIGQDKPVFVYKLVTAGTVEERMVELQERKRRLGEAVYERAATEADLLTADDLDSLLAPIGE
ncbi:DEAD/DEAH box helicase [Azospirillum agricola]|uniref:DEAD/DEAH box helicase n=1 Tax=Azospirillum agricola TaxID=1720247 RepID=UPI000A0EFF5A|nr:SNF2-related protein [Azospirillum agricola]SMH62616.1 Helicase conserved C-terminal domain-containing protein [Azospirillum lipoferum]